MKLYFNPQSRAVVAKWMLDECGADYETVLIDLKTKQQKSNDYLRINPSGKLPALEDRGATVFENAAICLYLADRFPQAKLAPAFDAAERGRYLSLVVFATSQLEPAMGDAFAELPLLPSRGWNDYETVKDVIEGELGDGPYLFGEWFTAADVMIGSMFIWQGILGIPLGRPKLDAYVERLLARPHALRLPPGAGKGA